jgi:hypothetical protein
VLLDPPVLELLGRQFFVASTEQLIDRGISATAIQRARRAGELLNVLPGIVRLAGTADTDDQRAIALLIRSGGDGILADITAGRLWGIPRLPRGRITMMVPVGRQFSLPDWARTIRTRWLDDRPVVRSDGLLVTSPERTLFELGARMGSKRFEHAAENLWNRELITPDGAARYLMAIRGKGRTGVSRLEAWLDSVQHRPRRASQSSLEIGLAHAVADLGLPPPERQFALSVNSGRVVIHLDLAWPHKRLGLEPGHSVFHAGRDAMRRDAERDRWCDEVGWRILRFDEVELRDLSACAMQVTRIYHQRQLRQ